jgi:hypothetical protein
MRSTSEIDAMRAQLEENIREHGWDPAVDAASRALEWVLNNTPIDGDRLFRLWMERPDTERRADWIARGGKPEDWPVEPERPVGSEEKNA